MMDINEIMQLLPHRFPMLLVDKVETIEAGERAAGYKYITYNEPFFQGHFPGKPVMPGVLIIEALTQLIHIMLVSVPEYCDRSVYYAKIEKAGFFKPVIPGNVLKLEVEKKNKIENLVVCNVKASVEDEPVFKAYITVMLTE